MDYLMLFPDQSRVVIEVDGRQHYSSGDKNQFSDPGHYAEMVREDRALRLRGYEVYRFGGAEFAGNDAAERVNEFFEALLSRHGLQA
jgi:very-short-patch-repair endonuclease